MTEIINPYSQHYRAIPRLLRNAIHTNIFTYLFDEHLALLKKGVESPVIKITTTTIAEIAGVNRNIVGSNLKQLEDIGLIVVEGKTCTMCANYIDSVVTLFNSKHTLKEKQAVEIAFREHDVVELTKLGLVESDQGNQRLMDLKGNIMPISVQNDLNINIDKKNAQMCAKKMPISVQNDLNASNMPISVQKKCLYLCNIMPISVQNKCTDVCNMLTFEQFCTLIGTIFSDKSDFLCTYLCISSTPEQEQEIMFVADLIFDPQSKKTDLSDFEKMLICVHFFAQMCAKFCTDMCNRNKEEINKKNECKERSDALVDIDGGVEEEEDSDDLFNNLEGEQPSVGYEKVNVHLEDIPVPVEQSIAIRRKQERLNKFSAEEVEEIISDINCCTESPAKIFIHFFWSALEDGFYQPSDVEDEDETELPSNIEGESVSASFVESCLQIAFEDTLQLLSEKRLTPDDELLPVVDAEFSADDIKVVVGWKQYTNYKGGSYFTITKDNFFNPQSPKQEVVEERIPRSRRSSGNENEQQEREEDYVYMQKIQLMGDNDDLYEALTPVEKFVYAFCVEYMQFDENLRINDLQITQLGPVGLDKVRNMERTEGLNKDDWKLIRFSDRQNSNGTERVIMRMFSARKIRALNKDRGYVSVVDDQSLEQLLS